MMSINKLLTIAPKPGILNQTPDKKPESQIKERKQVGVFFLKKKKTKKGV